MNQDLKIIKKKYGEKLMHLCRELFATILDNSPGILPQILLANFEPTHFLYDDLSNHIVNFKDYIYSLYDSIRVNDENLKKNTLHPKVLMHQVNYTLYECHTEEDIQKFRKYYVPGEALCTFNGGRLGRCHVFFAVKDHAHELNRLKFINPRRQDEYGTSVISIQFTRDGSHTLSIKNRYNHTVPDPDATFSNNLDNIIPGLTDSFKEHYSLFQSHQSIIDFEIPGYVRANDGKFYRYNYEINNVYYCPNNIVIDNFQVKNYDKSKYLVMDYFILDLVNKQIISKSNDAFPYSIPPIKKITINNDADNKTITLIPYEGENIVITINKYSQIIGVINNNLVNVPDGFLATSKYIENITLNNAKTIGNYFLKNSNRLKSIYLPNVIAIGNDFLYNNYNALEQISLPKVKIIGRHFCATNESLKTISLPNVIEIGNDFLSINPILKTVDLPKVKKIGSCFCYYNKCITRLEFPQVKAIDSGFLQQNKTVKELIFPKLESIDFFINSNKELDIFYAPLITSGTDRTQKVIHQKRLVKIKGITN